ncbi:hypothetical protein [Cryobacterium sp. Y11]|uniref:hypothetical protein n=1 Tax=Cryobacterium sp. Y11 TaxID=2045016 RepID=UPI000CE2EBE4|nr:hypothetical protein [Cryobacterium sp. Y11]
MLAPIRQRVTTLAVVLAVVTGLRGCGPVDAGSAAGSDFAKFLASETDVVDVSIVATNVLPFAGSADATVTLSDVSDDRLRELMHLIGEYDAAQEKTLAKLPAIQVITGGFTLQVDNIRADNEQVLDLYFDLRATPNSAGGVVGRDSVRGNVASADHLIEAYDATGALLDDDTLFTAAELSAADSSGRFSVSGGVERIRRDATIDAFAIVSAAFDLAGATLTSDAFGLKLQRQADVAPATAFIESLPDVARLGLVTITSGLVTQSGEGDFTTVNAIIDQLGDVDGVIEIFVSPNSLWFMVESVAAAQGIDVLLADIPTAAGLKSLQYQIADDETTLLVEGTDPVDRALALAAAASLLADDFVTSVEFSGVDARVVVQNSTGIAEFAPLARAALVPGSTNWISAYDGGFFQLIFEATTPLTVLPPRFETDETDPAAAAAFVTAWNAASHG